MAKQCEVHTDRFVAKKAAEPCCGFILRINRPVSCILLLAVGQRAARRLVFVFMTHDRWREESPDSTGQDAS